MIRNGDQSYSALQGTSAKDGCILEWDSRRKEGRLAVQLYRVWFTRGNVVKGLTTSPLLRYSVFTRGGVVFVGREL